MWDEWGRPKTLFVVTTNASIRKDGALVMGRGIAKEIRDRCPGLGRLAGRLVTESDLVDYGFITFNWTQRWDGLVQAVGLFQVKYHFKGQASVRLIVLATNKLICWCREHPEHRVNLNYPGIGFGRLTVEVVEPLLTGLPERVHIWRYPKDRQLASLTVNQRLRGGTK